MHAEVERKAVEAAGGHNVHVLLPRLFVVLQLNALVEQRVHAQIDVMRPIADATFG